MQLCDLKLLSDHEVRSAVFFKVVVVLSNLRSVLCMGFDIIYSLNFRSDLFVQNKCPVAEQSARTSFNYQIDWELHKLDLINIFFMKNYCTKGKAN